MPPARHLGDRLPARGFTLIELIIALGLGISILLALTLLFSRNSGNQQELERTVRQFENARFAVDTMTEDAMHAGYYSEFNPERADPAPTYTSPSPCAAAPADLGWDAAASPMLVPRPIEGIAAGTVVACLTNRRADTEALVVRHAETGPATTWDAGRAGNLYIQATRCESDVGLIRVAALPQADAPATFNLRLPNCTAPNNALRRLVQRTYYVANCNECNNGGDGIPTLKRVEMIDGTRVTTAIAEGVENVQFEFGVDNAAPLNGTPDAWFTTSGVVAADWQNVVAVRMHVLTRATQQTPGHVETRTFQLGPDVQLTPSSAAISGTGNAGFRRVLLSSVVRLNNVGSRRE